MRDGPGADAGGRRPSPRERKTLTNERISHVNRVKGLLFAQGVSGYEPLRRDRRKRLEELTTGDGRPLPAHLKAQIGRQLDRLELLLEQIKAVEADRDAMLAAEQLTSPAPDNAAQPERYRAGVCRCLGVGGAVTSLRQPTTGCRLCWASRRHVGRAGRSTTTKGYRKSAIQGCERR